MNIKKINVKEIDYIAPTWEQMGELIFELGKQILKTKNKYDWIISIAKGGWTWSRALADYLKLGLPKDQVKFFLMPLANLRLKKV